MIEPVKWKDNKIVFIDQTELPARLRYIKCMDIETLCEAVKKLKIRGAPLIGVAVGVYSPEDIRNAFIYGHAVFVSSSGGGAPRRPWQSYER